MREHHKGSDGFMILKEIGYHSSCEKRQEDNGHSYEHKRTSSESVDQNSSNNCANDLEESEHHHTYIRVGLISILND